MWGRGLRLGWGSMRFWKFFNRYLPQKTRKVHKSHMEEVMNGEQKKDYQTVILAALLHDIGKFMQRAEVVTTNYNFDLWREELCPEGYSYQHVVWTKYFIDEIIKALPPKIDKAYLTDIASYHHKTETIIREADILSSGMERYNDEKEQLTYKKTRLHSIFDIVELKYKMTDENGKFNSNWYYELNPLDLKSDFLFPVKKECLKPAHGIILKSEYEKLWYGNGKDIKGFVNEFNEIQQIHSFSYYFNSLYYLLQKYTWSIPSATNVFPDISLFDHLRTTSAIAACLHYYWNSGSKVNEKPFILLGGDISGIQDFIYKVTATQGIGGIAKRLRGRSFYLTMLPEIMSKYLIDKLGLTIANINFCGGGTFELLLPNIEEVKEKLQNIEESVNNWLNEEFYGELGLIIEKTELIKNELMQQYGDKKIELEDKIALKKKRKFSEKFKDQNFIVRKEKIEGTITICKSCNLTVIQQKEEEKDEICSQCKKHKKIGTELGKARYIVFSKDKLAVTNLVEITFGKFGEFGIVYLLDSFDTEILNMIKEGLLYDVQLINCLDDTHIKGFAFLGNTLPVALNKIKLKSEEVKDSQDEDERQGVVLPCQSLSFETLADMSIGDKKIGILKMDVDYLGYIFSMGLEISRPEEETRKLKSISRISTLSRGLNYFFTGCINAICSEVFDEWKTDEDNNWAQRNEVSNEDIKNIFYILYSGGDDLLIIGPWSEIPRLAQRINEKFREYTCHNPNITLSAGIFICKPKYPISIAARKAGDELDEKSKACGRNRITLFGETAVWDFEKGEQWREELKRDIEVECFKGKNPSQNKFKVKTFSDYFELANELYEGTKLEINKLPRSFIHDLITDYQEYFGDKDNPNLNIIPALVYKISRNVKDVNLKKTLWEKLITEGNAESYLRKIRLAADYALMKSRKS